jgi:hypothetical protein
MCQSAHHSENAGLTQGLAGHLVDVLMAPSSQGSGASRKPGAVHHFSRPLASAWLPQPAAVPCSTTTGGGLRWGSTTFCTSRDRGLIGTREELDEFVGPRSEFPILAEDQTDLRVDRALKRDAAKGCLVLDVGDLSREDGYPDVPLHRGEQGPGTRVRDDDVGEEPFLATLLAEDRGSGITNRSSFSSPSATWRARASG